MAIRPKIARARGVTRNRKIQIFLSYKLEDDDRANDLETAIRLAAEGGVDVFRARKIEPGTEWRKAICQNIAKSDILLLLYTDDSRSWIWCLFECGMFFGNDKDVENRLICLHHPEAELPDPLKHLKSFPITKDRARELLKYILHVYPHKRGLPPINPDLFEQDEAHRQLLDLCCGLIMKAIGEKAECHYVHDAWMRTTACPSDIIEKNDGPGRNTYDLQPDVRVELSEKLSAILGLHRKYVTWGKLDDEVLRRGSCREVIKDIWHAIQQIEAEGNARGINDPQWFPTAFGQSSEEICGMFDRWYRTREQLEEVCSACEICEGAKKDKKARCERLTGMNPLLDSLWDMNGRFLYLASARIHEVIASEE